MFYALLTHRTDLKLQRLDSKTILEGEELYSDKGLWNFSGPNAEALSKADVWSLGMTIENLETGENPCGKADLISDGLRPIVASMLCFNYKDRKSAAELLDELKSCERAL